LVEHLASHGYIVMALNHAFLSSGMRFANGSMIGLEILRRPNPFPNDAQQDRDEDALQAQLADPRSTTTERAELVRRLAGVNPSSTERWADFHVLMSGDQRFLLDSLGSLPPSLADRLDLDRVGVLGMSSGGTATHITCAMDPRCRAGLNMDGFQPLLIDLPPPRVPFMHMSRATVFTNQIAHERSQAPSYIVRVEGAAHLSFTDDVLTLHRLRRVGRLGSNVLGTVDPERMVQLVNDYTLAFFDQSLQGRGDPALDSPGRLYPEATLESKLGTQ
jgi:predicted dienelactone hydrolase